jgi:hypothetical protein
MSLWNSAIAVVSRDVFLRRLSVHTTYVGIIVRHPFFPRKSDAATARLVVVVVFSDST